MKIIKLTPENIGSETLFCVKDVKSSAFKAKAEWFERRTKEGLQIKILKDEKDKTIAFIEYIPAVNAWRPVDAENHMFIHCMVSYSKTDRNKGYASMLIKECEKDAKSTGMKGVCAMTSDGRWITDKRLFEKNGYKVVDQKDRFQLMSREFAKNSKPPKLLNWTQQQSKFKGWNLIYADQCPWHEKAVFALSETAFEYGIDLKIKKLNTASQARKAPSGFGTFSLIRDGRLIEDHYVSATRFRNILKKELA